MNLKRLLTAVIICQMAGILGSFFTAPSIPTWYAGLEKPDFNPPSWIFAPVWTILFLLMGISLYVIWSKGPDKKEIRKAIFIFGIQLLLNTLWSFLFFGLKSPLYALFEIIILWFFIFLSILEFYKISKTAAFLLSPYILWVSFASVLNFYIVLLN